MNSKLTALVTGAVLATGLSAGNAGELYVLSPAQMDEVTAGITSRSLEFNSSFQRVGVLFSNVINDHRVLELPTGTITSTINMASIGVRGFASVHQRTGSFQTTVVID